MYRLSTHEVDYLITVAETGNAKLLLSVTILMDNILSNNIPTCPRLSNLLLPASVTFVFKAGSYLFGYI